MTTFRARAHIRWTPCAEAVCELLRAAEPTDETWRVVADLAAEHGLDGAGSPLGLLRQGLGLRPLAPAMMLLGDVALQLCAEHAPPELLAATGWGRTVGQVIETLRQHLAELEPPGEQEPALPPAPHAACRAVDELLNAWMEGAVVGPDRDQLWAALWLLSPIASGRPPGDWAEPIQQLLEALPAASLSQLVAGAALALGRPEPR